MLWFMLRFILMNALSSLRCHSAIIVHDNFEVREKPHAALRLP